jgi:oxaloacetate decarboxylase gamma subunit
MLIDGVVVALIGMGTVFIFLTMVVALIDLMSRVMQSFPDPPSPDSRYADRSDRTQEEIAVVIAAARAFAQEAKQQ